MRRLAKTIVNDTSTKPSLNQQTAATARYHPSQLRVVRGKSGEAPQDRTRDGGVEKALWGPV